MDLIKKLTGKNPSEYEAVAKSLVNNCDTNLFEKLVKQDDFLFHKRDGDFCYPQAPDDWIYVIYHHDKTLRRITPHGFRHTLATLLYQGDSRIKPQDVQLLLGHSKVTTALNIYTHVTNENKKTIEDSINNLDI